MDFEQGAPPLTRALIEAICAHDPQALEQALAATTGDGEAIDGRDERGDTPLIWAIRESQPRAAERLLAAGADPNLGPRPGTTPLSLSISLWEYAIAASLMKTPGLDRANQGFAAATDAVMGGVQEGLQCLVGNGLDLRQEVPAAANLAGLPDQATALLFMATAHALHRPELFRYLLEQGADPGASITGGLTLAGLACQKVNEYPETLQVLLDAGASPRQLDQAGYGPLHYAAAQDHGESVKRLLAAGAPVDQRAADGSFALLWAAANGRGVVHGALCEPTDSSRLAGLVEAVAALPATWSWQPGAGDRGALSLAAGDGAWHDDAWGTSDESVMTGLARKYGSSRGRTSPSLVIRLLEPEQGTSAPAPWLRPGRRGMLRCGDVLDLTYVAPRLPHGIPRALPTAMSYRFRLTTPEVTERSGLTPGMVHPLEILQIVSFEDGRMDDLPVVSCRFDGRRWLVH